MVYYVGTFYLSPKYLVIVIQPLFLLNNYMFTDPYVWLFFLSLLLIVYLSYNILFRKINFPIKIFFFIVTLCLSEIIAWVSALSVIFCVGECSSSNHIGTSISMIVFYGWPFLLAILWILREYKRLPNKNVARLSIGFIAVLAVLILFFV